MFVPFAVEDQEYVSYRQRLPVAVYSLVGVCVLVHILVHVNLGENARLNIFYTFGAVKFHFAWWSALTCTFLHGGWLHLLGNMYFLWIYGRSLERLLGTGRFLLLYFGGGFLSVLVHILTVSPFYLDEPTVGASGAISAVLGAFLILWPTAKLRTLLFSPIAFRPLVVPAPAWVVLGLWFTGQLIYSLKLVGDFDEIAFWAHVGGFVAGAGIGTFLQRQLRRDTARAERELKRPMT